MSIDLDSKLEIGGTGCWAVVGVHMKVNGAGGWRLGSVDMSRSSDPLMPRC